MTRVLTRLVALQLALQLALQPAPQLGVRRGHMTLGARARRDERGSVTTEHVLWAVAVIAIVGIVVAALRAYVQTQAGKIK